jgi:hypothetical protein
MKFANANKLDRKSGGSPTIAFSIRPRTASIIELSGRTRENFANFRVSHTLTQPSL